MPSALVGHLQAQSRLANLLETGRFPHATLIHGPRGIGKFLMAQHLAWRLICGPNPQENNMFGEGEGSGLSYNEDSPQAAQLTAHSCPDYHIVTVEEGKKSIGIKQIKTLLETLGRSADTARVIVLDALEDLTDEAANTLLKTLEEPRPGIYFFLISHQLSAVLPTIRSRCRLLPLQPLSRDEVAQVLAANGANPALAVTAGGAPGNVLGQGGGRARETP